MQTPQRKPPGCQRLPGSDLCDGIEVLLIGRDLAMPIYTDEVLRRAGFRVRTVTPMEATEVPGPAAPVYPLVVFSDTLYPRDISEIGQRLRHRYPASKLLLMLGPDSTPENFSIFDAMMEGLEGPAALIRMARRLAGLSSNDPNGDDLARSA